MKLRLKSEEVGEGMMNGNKLTVCACSGILGMALIFVAAGPLWHMLPPLSPLMTAKETADHFRENSMGILIGGVVQLTGLCLLLVFSGGLTACMKEMEGEFSPYTDGFRISFPLIYVTIFLPGAIFSCLAFRADWPDDLVRMMADMAVVILVSPGVLGTIPFTLLGLVILGDKRPEPIFPRWTGYLALVVAVLLAPGNAVTFFKAGPFAWDGLFTLLVPGVAYGLLMWVLAWSMMRAGKRRAVGQAQGGAVAA